MTPPSDRQALIAALRLYQRINTVKGEPPPEPPGQFGLLADSPLKIRRDSYREGYAVASRTWADALSWMITVMMAERAEAAERELAAVMAKLERLRTAGKIE